MKQLLLLLALALCATGVHLTAAPDSKDNGAKDAASHFYRTYLKMNPRGLPTDQEMKTFKPLLSADLFALLTSAIKKQEKFIKSNPDQKPPWAEGNLFASNYEGVTSFTLGEPSVDENKASIPVYLEYREGQNVARWIDVIVLERTGKEWRVWEIFMNAPWDFRSGPSLRAILASE